MELMDQVNIDLDRHLILQPNSLPLVVDRIKGEKGLDGGGPIAHIFVE